MIAAIRPAGTEFSCPGWRGAAPTGQAFWATMQSSMPAFTQRSCFSRPIDTTECCTMDAPCPRNRATTTAGRFTACNCKAAKERVAQTRLVIFSLSMVQGEAEVIGTGCPDLSDRSTAITRLHHTRRDDGARRLSLPPVPPTQARSPSAMHRLKARQKFARKRIVRHTRTMGLTESLSSSICLRINPFRSLSSTNYDQAWWAASLLA
jgi:hypothetical protein